MTIIEMVLIGKMVFCIDSVDITQCKKNFLQCVNKYVKITGNMPVSDRTKIGVLRTNIVLCGRQI